VKNIKDKRNLFSTKISNSDKLFTVNLKTKFK